MGSQRSWLRAHLWTDGLCNTCHVQTAPAEIGVDDSGMECVHSAVVLRLQPTGQLISMEHIGELAGAICSPSAAPRAQQQLSRCTNRPFYLFARDCCKQSRWYWESNLIEGTHGVYFLRQFRSSKSICPAWWAEEDTCPIPGCTFQRLMTASHWVEPSVKSSRTILQYSQWQCVRVDRRSAVAAAIASTENDPNG